MYRDTYLYCFKTHGIMMYCDTPLYLYSSLNHSNQCASNFSRQMIILHYTREYLKRTLLRLRVRQSLMEGWHAVCVANGIYFLLSLVSTLLGTIPAGQARNSGGCHSGIKHPIFYTHGNSHIDKLHLLGQKYYGDFYTIRNVLTLLSFYFNNYLKGIIAIEYNSVFALGKQEYKKIFLGT